MRKVKILFLAANPTDTSYLRLEEEISAIDEELLKARFRDKFDLDQKHAVKADDLSQHLLQVEPDIIHFSGHGSSAGQIYLEDEEGKSHPVSERTLGNLFSVVGGNIRCVVLNACYSATQAEAISKHVDCVIGMSKAIGDEAAIEFAQGFYRGLGYGKDIETSFKLGCAQIDLQNLDEQNTPRILWKNNHPRKINFDQLAEPNTSSIKETTTVIEHEKNSARENETTNKTKKILSWKTVPGILAIITVAIIAITGLVVGFSAMFAQPSPTPQSSPTPQPAAAVLLPPNMTWPPDNNKFYLTLPLPDKVLVEFNWSNVEEATHYEIQIYYDSKPYNFLNKSENSTKFLWADTVASNIYKFNVTHIYSKHWWFVRSVNNKMEKSPWSEVRSFYFETPPS